MWWITLLETAATWSLHLIATSPETWPGRWGTHRFNISFVIFSLLCTNLNCLCSYFGSSVLPLLRWRVWWWTRMERRTTCCQARGMRSWNFHGWCRAAEEEKTARRANRKLSIKPSKLERCGGGTHSCKCCHSRSHCLVDSVWLFGVSGATARGQSPCTTSLHWHWRSMSQRRVWLQQTAASGPTSAWWKMAAGMKPTPRSSGWRRSSVAPAVRGRERLPASVHPARRKKVSPVNASRLRSCFHGVSLYN